MPFFAEANDNSTKQSEAPVGHHIWATDTPTHSLSLLPMAWPSFTSINTPVPQLCVPLTQALMWRFGNPKFNTSEKQRTCSQRPHGSSTYPQALLTTLQCDKEEYRRLTCHRGRPMGAVFTAQKMPSCETEEAVGEEVRRERHLPRLTCVVSFVQRGSNDTVVAVPSRACTSLSDQ
ncbi:hypothetical protein TcG_11543 [Trypanosoma cruzi]|nr:hypothetical protein TcG_11543 [Trypanosoma cruzi]